MKLRNIFFIAIVVGFFLSSGSFCITQTGTTIESQTELSYGGSTYITSEALVIVQQMYGITLEPHLSSAYAIPGSTHYFHYMLNNLGNGSDLIGIRFNTTTLEGWMFSLIKDDNGNCTFDAGIDVTPVSSEVPLSEEGMLCFFLAITVPTAESTGTTGQVIIVATGEGRDGGTYIGANGTIYGGGDTLEAISVLTVEALSNFRINRDDATGQIFLSWNGGTADIYYHNGTYEASQSSYTIEAYGAGSPYYCASIESKDGKNRYYRAALAGSSSFVPQTVGKFDIPVTVGMNQLSCPLVIYDGAIASIIGSQVTGGPNSGASDRLWKYNFNTFGKFDIAWLVSGIGPQYDGAWYSGSYPTTIKLGTDEGWFLQIRDGNPATYITMVGEVSNVNRSIPIAVGMNMVGSCFPVTVTIEASNLWVSGFTGAPNSGASDRLWTYNANTFGKYDIAWIVDGVSPQYNGKVFSGSYPTSMNLTPGKSYWIQIRSGRSPFTWNYIKPY
jgi:hypothetical protein